MLGAVLLLIAAAGKHPYGFYMVLRLVITVGAVYWAWRVYKAGQRAWTWMFVAVALLLNPFLPIRMQRTQWQPIDLCLGILLIGWSGYWLFRKRTREFEIKRLAEEKAKKTNEVYRDLSDLQKRRLYKIAWTAVCLLWGGVFSLAVSAPDSGLGLIEVFALAFGGFACAAMLWSRGISNILSKNGITKFAMRSMTTGLIICAILSLNFVGSFAARPSTPKTQLRASVPATSALPVPIQNNASDASKRAVTNGVSGASAGCHPPVFSQQELSALKLRATNGNAEAQCMLGDSYDEGKGVPQDYTQASFWWRKAAEQGDADAQDNLGYSYGYGQGVPKDDTLAVLWWRKAAEQGLADAQDDLGVSYENGEGAPQDYAQAALWFRRAAEQGDAHAQYHLGTWYKEGKNQGVPQDDAQTTFWRRKIRAWRAYIDSVDFHRSEHWRYAQAAFWYRKAAEQGSADAQDALGDLYNSGQGVRQDYAQAALWYRKAAEQGNDEAQDALGDLYDLGQGVPKDYAQAALWYRKAAEQGNADAQDSLGDLYDTGRGVPRDYAEAYFWYDLAAAGEEDSSDEEDASDSKHVAKDRDEAASHLTPADLFREQGRAGKWFEAHQEEPQ
jgi:TPR repeat protein